MNDKRLDLKTYTKFDKTFMFFGSACNAAQGWVAKNVKTTEELNAVLDSILYWAQTRISRVVSDVYGDVDPNGEARKIEKKETAFDVRDLDEGSEVETV